MAKNQFYQEANLNTPARLDTIPTRLDQLFQLLHSKTDYSEHMGLHLPDTISYFNFNAPTWYFMSKQNSQILRKNSYNVTSDHIFDAFCRPLATQKKKNYEMTHEQAKNYKLIKQEARKKKMAMKMKAEKENSSKFGREVKKKSDSDRIVAVLVIQNQFVSGRVKTETSFLDKHKLKKLLFDKKRKQISNGFLQKFVLPSFDRNTGIKVRWTPGKCTIEQKMCMYKMNDSSVPLEKRLSTLQNEENLVTGNPLDANIQAQVIRICDHLVKHIYQATNHVHKVRKMELSLKLDNYGKLWFLWFDSFRTSTEDILEPARWINFQLCDPEMTGRSEEAIEQKRREKRRLMRGDGIHGSSQCPNCDKDFERQYGEDVFYKVICKYHALTNNQDEKFSEMIPPAIRKIDPHLNPVRFQSELRNPTFFNRQVKLCEECGTTMMKTIIQAKKDSPKHQVQRPSSSKMSQRLLEMSRPRVKPVIRVTTMKPIPPRERPPSSLKAPESPYVVRMMTQKVLMENIPLKPRPKSTPANAKRKASLSSSKRMKSTKKKPPILKGFQRPINMNTAEIIKPKKKKKQRKPEAKKPVFEESIQIPKVKTVESPKDEGKPIQESFKELQKKRKELLRQFISNENSKRWSMTDNSDFFQKRLKQLVKKDEIRDDENSPNTESVQNSPNPESVENSESVEKPDSGRQFVVNEVKDKAKENNSSDDLDLDNELLEEDFEQI